MPAHVVGKKGYVSKVLEGTQGEGKEGRNPKKKETWNSWSLPLKKKRSPAERCYTSGRKDLRFQLSTVAGREESKTRRKKEKKQIGLRMRWESSKGSGGRSDT